MKQEIEKRREEKEAEGRHTEALDEGRGMVHAWAQRSEMWYVGVS